MYLNSLLSVARRPAQIGRLWAGRLLILCLSYALSGSFLCAQTIRYVKPEGLLPPFSNPATATSWNTATGDLQGAIDASQPGDEVWVAVGTYKPTSNTANRGGSFSMKNGVKIYGGYVLVRGGGSYARGSLNPSGSILSGDIDNNGTLANNSYHVIRNANGLSNSALLDGFVITDGNADGNGVDATGAGMLNNGSGTGSICNPTISNCIFHTNLADTGGAIYNDGTNFGRSSPLLTNCFFQNNSATQGGAISNYCSGGTSSPVLINCAFQSNSASYIGGAIYINAGTGTSSPIITNCSFLNNTATDGGGAISVYGETLISPAETLNGYINSVLTNCVLWNNGGNSTFQESFRVISYSYPPDNNKASKNSTSSFSMSYCLYETSVMSFSSVTGNLTTNTSPFVSLNSIALNSCSPAINAGNPNTTALNVGLTDLAGNARFYNSGRIDMGAVEFQGTPSSPARLYVNASATGSSTGLSWADAFTDLQTALNYSCSGNLTEIWVAQGTYKPTTGTDRSRSFAMKNGVAIYGGFSGTETNLSQRILSFPSSTTLSGDINNDNLLDNGNSYHVIYNPASLSLNNTAVLDGFVITGGYANGSNDDSKGGGMFNKGSGTGSNCSPTIRNCSFVSNVASDKGGAIINMGASGGNANAQVINTRFQNNTATNGGAIGNDCSSAGTSTPRFINCSFVDNLATNSGGAINNDASNSGINFPSFINCSFQGNSASSGGALKNYALFGGPTENTGSRVRLTNCIFWNNGGSGTISNDYQASTTATYGLFDGAAISGITTSANNLTATTSPFLSATSIQLAANSPAINAGDPTTTTAIVGATDLAENPRIVGGRVDMGAVEFQGSPCQSVAIINPYTSIGQSIFRSICVGNPFSVQVSTTGTVSGYQWYKDGVALAGQTSATLTLPAVTTANAGNYSIVVTGACSSATATILQLSVDVLAGFTSQPPSVITSCEGTTVTVGVSFSGTTGGPIRWYKFGAAGPFVLDGQNSATLSLPNVTTASAGTYYVQVPAGACNRDGTLSQPTISASFSLIINAAPSRLYVNRTATGANTGLNWTDAFTDLQSALTYTCSGNLTEIWVAQGTYKPTTGTDRTRSFAMKNGVAIYGGFVGNETILSQRNWATNPTILSGDLGIPANTTDNSYHVIANRALTATAILDGFTITGGNANGASPFNCGGGMYNYAIGSRTTPGDATCSPKIRNCQFIYNTATNGGAVYNEAQTGQGDGTTSPQFINCLFLDNSATSGGAMYTTTGISAPVSTPQLLNCTFQNNAAGSGGALFNFRSGGGSVNPQLTNCVLWGNGADNTIVNYFGQGTVTATYSLFDNTVTGYTAGSGNLTTTTTPLVLASAQLRTGSPAIDAGEPSTTTATVGPADLASNPRIVNGRVDMGAVEFQADTQGPIVTIKNGQWTDPTVWSVGRVPAAGDEVTVQHTVVIPAFITATVRRLTYGSGGKIQYEAPSALLKLGF